MMKSVESKVGEAVASGVSNVILFVLKCCLLLVEDLCFLGEVCLLYRKEFIGCPGIRHQLSLPGGYVHTVSSKGKTLVNSCS